MASEVTLATKPHLKWPYLCDNKDGCYKTWLGQTEISGILRCLRIYIYIYVCVYDILYSMCIYIYILIILCVGTSSHITTKHMYHAVDIHIFEHVHR